MILKQFKSIEIWSAPTLTSIVLLPVELGHGTFVRLVGGIVTLTTGLADEVTTDFLQPFRVLHLLETHWRLRLRVHAG